MSGRKKGWDLAQLRTSFLADPEFIRLRMACRGDTQFLAAVGLWTIALAQAWREDDGDVADLVAAYPRQAAPLSESELVVDGQFRGFESWIGAMRQRREDDAARKRGEKPPARESGGRKPTPPESSGVQREERSGRGSGEVEHPSGALLAGAREGIVNLVGVETAWADASGRTLLDSGAYAMDYLEDATRRHGEAAVITAIREARKGFPHIPATQPLAVAVRNLLDPLPNSKDTQAAEAAKRETTRSRRAVEATIRQAHETGFHEKASDERCPLCR